MLRVRRAPGSTGAAADAFARTLQFELRTRGSVSSVHLHDRFFGFELLRFSADVASQRNGDERPVGWFFRTSVAGLRRKNELPGWLWARILATGHAGFYSGESAPCGHQHVQLVGDWTVGREALRP